MQQKDEQIDLTTAAAPDRTAEFVRAVADHVVRELADRATPQFQFFDRGLGYGRTDGAMIADGVIRVPASIRTNFVTAYVQKGGAWLYLGLDESSPAAFVGAGTWARFPLAGRDGVIIRATVDATQIGIVFHDRAADVSFGTCGQD